MWGVYTWVCVRCAWTCLGLYELPHGSLVPAHVRAGCGECGACAHVCACDDDMEHCRTCTTTCREKGTYKATATTTARTPTPAPPLSSFMNMPAPVTAPMYVVHAATAAHAPLMPTGQSLQKPEGVDTWPASHARHGGRSGYEEE